MVVPAYRRDGPTPLVNCRISNIGEKHRSPLCRWIARTGCTRTPARMLAMDAHPFVIPQVRKYLEKELHLMIDD
jgi:hypothetical protein